MKLLLLIVISYLLGSIPFALIAGRLSKGIDIREYGSGNLGATNAFRVLGVKLGIIVISADIIKGAIPAYLGLLWGGDVWAVAAGVCAIVGHSYPIFAGLKGGKSIATGAGVFLVLMPSAIIVAIIVFIIVLLSSQYVSLASLLGALSLLVTSIVLQYGLLKIVAVALVFAFVVYRHRANIERLLHGRENKAKLWRH